MHHAFLYILRLKETVIASQSYEVISVFFFSFLLSRPQAAVALQGNTRPSTHDAPLPVYGQETARPVPLPHYRAGKVSFFCPPLLKLQQDNTTMYKDFQGLNFLFFLSKKRQIPVPFFAFQGRVVQSWVKIIQGECEI